MGFLSRISLLLVIFLGFVFAVLNNQTVEVNYGLGHYHGPMSVLLVLVFGAGIFLGLLSSIFSSLSLRRDKLVLRTKVETLEKEIESLRALSDIHEET